MTLRPVEDQEHPEDEPHHGDAPDDVEGGLPTHVGHDDAAEGEGDHGAEVGAEEAARDEAAALRERHPPGDHGVQGRVGAALADALWNGYLKLGI